MKSPQILLLAFVLSACQGNVRQDHSVNVKLTDTARQPVLVDCLGDLQEIVEREDSAGYVITRHRDTSMRLLSECKAAKTESWDVQVIYNTNGRIGATGKSLPDKETRIGKWRFYSEKGELDSLIDYDKLYRVPFEKALSMALRRGYKNENRKVMIEGEGKNCRWIFETDRTSVGGNSEWITRIEINTRTGKVHRVIAVACT